MAVSYFAAAKYGRRRMKRQIMPRQKKKNPNTVAFGFWMGEGGFGPPKSVTTDLQSAPFGRSGIPPYGSW